MPAQRFTISVDSDELAKADLAFHRPTSAGDDASHAGLTGQDQPHHGARDNRQAARERSDRDHARTSGRGGRAYAFRRS